MSQASHQKFLLHTLNLAKIRRGFCAPNPSVGAVIVSNNEVIAEGFHLAPGHSHAEVDAIKKLNKIPPDAVIYVTLEPCCHFGRTPPCVNAIIESKIKKVFYAFKDPNPIVAGKGEQKLKEAGIECTHLPLDEINSFYQSYAYWHQSKLPFVTAKIAISIDGKIAKENGEPIQLTGPEINRCTHLQRKCHDAILTTAKTILADDPQLNARVNDEVIAKPIYIIDRELKLTGNEKIFSTAKSITIFYSDSLSTPKRRDCKGAHAFIKVSEKNKLLNLTEILTQIGQDGIHDLWIEAGGKCFSNVLESNLVNRALIYLAPIFLEKGLPAFHFNNPILLKNKKIKTENFGTDVLYEINF